MSHVSFEVTKAEIIMIGRIVRRAVKIAEADAIEVDPLSLEMDITAAHANGCPLDLQKFLDSPDWDFGHDVFGIRKYIDRKTGELTDCFVPRCAKPEADCVAGAVTAGQVR